MYLNNKLYNEADHNWYGLTLTLVVFELREGAEGVTEMFERLTLTLVVFEYYLFTGNSHVDTCLTLTLVVFEYC